MKNSAEYDSDVVIVGAGPVGMLLSYQLDRLGVGCFIAEKNLETTKWPKMDLTNCRSMEILRVISLADDYRAQPDAVNAEANFDSIFVTGLGPSGRLLGSWRLPSVQEQRDFIKRNNDGSQPAEPGQRCSQIIFEAWLKRVIVSKPHVNSRFGWTYVHHTEDENGVVSIFVDNAGKGHAVRSRYLVACDGGGSRVRKNAGIVMVGGQIPVHFYLVHFRSAQLARELRFGRFWHAFPAGTGFLIDQDEKDTFTAHYPLSWEEQGKTLDPYTVVHKMLGGSKGEWRIKIDQILVHSEWQPSFSVAKHYSSDNGRVLLAGDAAHRNPPHGGYGLNSGVVDAVDLGWRLAGVIKGYAGEQLLRAYGTERRPMMIRALRRSHRHVLEHVMLGGIYQQNWDMLETESPEGEKVRGLVRGYITSSGPETQDRGIELDLRYDHSPFIYPDGTPPVPWDHSVYHPSTRPGSRAPHVYLKDGVTSIYDHFGPEWTLVQFVEDLGNEDTNSLLIAAERFNFPIKHAILRGEDHAWRIWERRLVLVRPDTHVAWRGDAPPATQLEAEAILEVVGGRRAFPGHSGLPDEEETEFLKIVTAFAGNNSNDDPTILGDKDTE